MLVNTRMIQPLQDIMAIQLFEPWHWLKVRHIYHLYVGPIRYLHVVDQSWQNHYKDHLLVQANQENQIDPTNAAKPVSVWWPWCQGSNILVVYGAATSTTNHGCGRPTHRPSCEFRQPVLHGCEPSHDANQIEISSIEQNQVQSWQENAKGDPQWWHCASDPKCLGKEPHKLAEWARNLVQHVPLGPASTVPPIATCSVVEVVSKWWKRSLWPSLPRQTEKESGRRHNAIHLPELGGGFDRGLHQWQCSLLVAYAVALCTPQWAPACCPGHHAVEHAVHTAMEHRCDDPPASGFWCMGPTSLSFASEQPVQMRKAKEWSSKGRTAHVVEPGGPDVCHQGPTMTHPEDRSPHADGEIYAAWSNAKAWQTLDMNLQCANQRGSTTAEDDWSIRNLMHQLQLSDNPTRWRKNPPHHDPAKSRSPPGSPLDGGEDQTQPHDTRCNNGKTSVLLVLNGQVHQGESR